MCIRDSHKDGVAVLARKAHHLVLDGGAVARANALDPVSYTHPDVYKRQGEALIDHKVAGIGQNSLVQTGDVAQQIIEAIAGHAACSVHINAVEALHDLGVVRDLSLIHISDTANLRLSVAVVAHGRHLDVGLESVRVGVPELLELCLLYTSCP